MNENAKTKTALQRRLVCGSALAKQKVVCVQVYSTFPARSTFRSVGGFFLKKVERGHGQEAISM